MYLTLNIIFSVAYHGKGMDDKLQKHELFILSEPHTFIEISTRVPKLVETRSLRTSMETWGGGQGRVISASGARPVFWAIPALLIQVSGSLRRNICMYRNGSGDAPPMAQFLWGPDSRRRGLPSDGRMTRIGAQLRKW